MYAIPNLIPAHWPRLIQAGLTPIRDEKREAQIARAAHARNCRQSKRALLKAQGDLFDQKNGEIETRTGARSATARGSISPFFALESNPSFFVRGRSSTA